MLHHSLHKDKQYTTVRLLYKESFLHLRFLDLVFLRGLIGMRVGEQEGIKKYKTIKQYIIVYIKTI